MPSNWLAPSVDELKSAFGSVFTPQDNGEDFDPEDAATTWLPIIVAEFRGAILNGGRTALSKTAGSVPPEAKVHVLALAVEGIIVNTPRLVGYIVLEGENGPMARMIIAARAFLKAVTMGQQVTTPTDPDPATIPSGVVWGDDNGTGSADSVMTDLTIDSPPR